MNTNSCPQSAQVRFLSLYTKTKLLSVAGAIPSGYLASAVRGVRVASCYVLATDPSVAFMPRDVYALVSGLHSPDFRGSSSAPPTAARPTRVRYSPRDDGSDRPHRTSIWDVVSRREARLLFWLIVIALVAVIATSDRGVHEPSSSAPAIILFVAWLMAYVLEPAVSFLHRHLPFKGRGPVGRDHLPGDRRRSPPSCSSAPGVAILNAAIAFLDNLPRSRPKLGEILGPILDGLGAHHAERRRRPRDGDPGLVHGERRPARGRGGAGHPQRGRASSAGSSPRCSSRSGWRSARSRCSGWMRRFLPTSTYRDLSELEQAIAVSFGGFVRGRLAHRRHLRRSSSRHRRGPPRHPVRAAHRGHRRPDRRSSRGSARSSGGSSCRRSRCCSPRVPSAVPSIDQHPRAAVHPGAS